MARTIAMLVFDDAQALDVAGPLEVFALASRELREREPGAVVPYATLLVGPGRAPVSLASGIRVLPDRGYSELEAGIDTLLVSGGMGAALDRARADRALVAWLGDIAPRMRRIASVCNGALLLAEAGVLDGCEATTHWRDTGELASRYPAVRVVPDAIYTRTGEVWTSAGITAGMDMALAMVAADHGLPLALAVAKRMVMVAKRSGGQSQFSRELEELDVPDRLADLARWIRAHLRAPLDAGLLADRMHMSTRQFARRFAAAFGTTPQKYVERLRVDAAKALLESGTATMRRVASDSGFASEDAFRRAFRRHAGVTPREYRQRFGSP
ncbi:helix-turn-helix domain-containing protein [Luteimonas sp. RD2P54]|uniref:Helix-turn-helix domain-containing protein n=1 Tax=Luteimonas endophytica TaxID=3042023 RepID=A0ABT6JFT9_9GAMM|nr:helix-turn-helix domain-containing protein [Luteimonas endophytica]MDH5825043.1 helix-turn-helix domain-containing protein [Luteimonas endophytica]